MHVSLQESTLRLPGEQEVLLFQIAQAVAQDVRRGAGTANLWVVLEVDPPSARLQVEHDGAVGDALASRARRVPHTRCPVSVARSGPRPARGGGVLVEAAARRRRWRCGSCWSMTTP